MTDVFYAMVVDESNVDEVKKLLADDKVGQYILENPYWVIWGIDPKKEALLIPHRVFRKKYTVVGHAHSNLLVEKL